MQSILTERLELRPLTRQDAVALQSFRGHPNAVRYLSHGALTAEQTGQLLADLLTRAELSTAEWFHFGWAIALRCKGYGREAAGALVHWLFTRRGTDAVYAGVYEPNTASRRLLENLGFVRDRYFTASQDAHGKGLPSWRYRLDREAWVGRPAYGHNSTPGGSRR